MGGVGVYFFVRNSKEKPVQFPGFVIKAGLALKQRLARKI
jgi:lipopolysaccharide export system permease protein